MIFRSTSGRFSTDSEGSETSSEGSYCQSPRKARKEQKVYQMFVAQLATSMSVQQLQARGRVTPSDVRNAVRGATAGAAALHYDTSQDPVHYATHIASTVVKTAQTVSNS